MDDMDLGPLLVPCQHPECFGKEIRKLLNGFDANHVGGSTWWKSPEAWMYCQGAQRPSDPMLIMLPWGWRNLDSLQKDRVI